MSRLFNVPPRGGLCAFLCNAARQQGIRPIEVHSSDGSTEEVSVQSPGVCLPYQGSESCGSLIVQVMECAADVSA